MPSRLMLFSTVATHAAGADARAVQTALVSARFLMLPSAAAGAKCRCLCTLPVAPIRSWSGELLYSMPSCVLCLVLPRCITLL